MTSLPTATVASGYAGVADVGPPPELEAAQALHGLDFGALERAAVAAAEEAGDFLRGRGGSGARFRGKGAGGDVVSDLDDGAEQLILHRLRQADPRIPVLAEESGLAAADDEALLWLVDPLDGTNNLAIGLPAYAVGIALCRSGRPVLSVVHEPETRRTWTAVAGRGVRGPGAALRTSADALEDPWSARRPVVAWTQGYRVAPTDPLPNALKLLLDREARRTLALWAPLLGWSMLARGDIGAFIGYRPELIDLPGGLLLAREAGLRVVTLDGRPFTARLDQRTGPDADLSFICGRPERIADLVDLVARADRLAPGLARAIALEA